MAYMPKTKVKALGKVMLQYIKISAETGVHDPDLEALRPFFGKKGQVLKRPLRSKKQQAKFEEAVKTAKGKYGTKPSSAKMKKEMQRRKEAAEAQKQKATKTFRKRKVKEAKESGGKKNFRSEAQKAAKRYSTMVNVFMDDAMRELMRAYGIGSPIIEYLAEQGLTADEIKAFIIQWTQKIDDMPDEARSLASMDEMFSILVMLNANYSPEDFEDLAAMFDMSLSGADLQMDYKVTMRIIDLWEDAGGSENIKFTEFWKKMKEYEDPYNIDNAREVLDYYDD